MKPLLLVWNGFNYNITGAVFDYLLHRGYPVKGLAFPLEAHESGFRHILDARDGRLERKVVSYPLVQPFHYLMDVALLPRAADFGAIVSFNPLFSAWYLTRSPSVSVVNWSIDYSPRRFSNPLLNLVYNRVSSVALKRSTLHVDISTAALEARERKYGRRTSPA